MKQFIRKTIESKRFLIALGVLMAVLVFPANAQSQQVETGYDMKGLKDQHMEYTDQLKEIIEKYPTLSYQYSIQDGEVQDVVVTGIDNVIERKRLEVILFDLNSHRNMMKQEAERVGVFYEVDKSAMYKNGEESLHDELMSHLEYPEGAKNWGVEGTIYVKMVVDDDGTIPFATTATNIETSRDDYLDDLKEQAIAAVKETSGDWKPATVEGVEVASLAVVPITFEIETSPFF